MTAAQITKLENALDAALDNLVALETAGPQAWTDYSVDGESYQYEQAKAGLARRIESLQSLLQRLQPFTIRSKMVI